MKEITMEKLEQKIKKGEEVRIIDVREDEEVAAIMIPTALHIKFGEIPDRMHELNKNENYYIVCRAGVRSGKACEYLSHYGYDVTNVKDGMLEYKGNK